MAVLFDVQGGPVGRGRPRTAAPRQKSVRVFLPEASVRRGLCPKREVLIYRYSPLIVCAPRTAKKRTQTPFLVSNQHELTRNLCNPISLPILASLLECPPNDLPSLQLPLLFERDQCRLSCLSELRHSTRRWSYSKIRCAQDPNSIPNPVLRFHR